MRDYGKVHTTFWTSDDTSGLSDTGKLLALYLLTGPHANILGCFKMGDGYVMDDLGWTAERVSEGFAELSRKGFANRDQGSKWVVISAYLKWNPIENPNQGVAAGRLYEQIPSSTRAKELLTAALRLYGRHFPVDLLNAFETLSERFGKGLAVGLANQEQEQEQEQQQEQEHTAPPAPGEPPAPPVPTPASTPARTVPPVPPEPKFDLKAELAARGVQDQTAADWLKLRKAQRAPVTHTVLKKFIAEADKASMPLERVLSLCCAKGWRGFEAEWVENLARGQPKSQISLEETQRRNNEEAMRLLGIPSAEVFDAN